MALQNGLQLAFPICPVAKALDMLQCGFAVHAGDHSVFIGNIVSGCWMANSGFGSINKILFDRTNRLSVFLYHPEKTSHDS